MPRKRPKLREDTAETAFRVLQEAIGERPKTVPPSERTQDQKDSVAQKLGRKGGKKGGKARVEKMTEEERAKSATIAALARWKKGD